MALMQELAAAGITVVLVTHEHDIAAHLGRVVTVRDGKILSDKAQIPVPAVLPAEELASEALEKAESRAQAGA